MPLELPYKYAEETILNLLRKTKQIAKEIEVTRLGPQK